MVKLQALKDNTFVDSFSNTLGGISLKFKKDDVFEAQKKSDSYFINNETNERETLYYIFIENVEICLSEKFVSENFKIIQDTPT